jgi:hypothetical protein
MLTDRPVEPLQSNAFSSSIDLLDLKDPDQDLLKKERKSVRVEDEVEEEEARSAPLRKHPSELNPPQQALVTATDTSSAAAPVRVEKNSLPPDPMGDRFRHPGHRYPQLCQVGLGHIWIGPKHLDFLPELVEACCRHLKKVEKPHQYGDGLNYLNNRIRSADWAAIELRLQEMEQHLEPKQVPINPAPTFESSNDEAFDPNSPEAIASRQRIKEMLAAQGLARESKPSSPPAATRSSSVMSSLSADFVLDPPDESAAIDLSDVQAEIQVHLNRLGWSEETQDVFLYENYRVTNRHKLQDSDLAHFLVTLRAM